MAVASNNCYKISMEEISSIVTKLPAIPQVAIRISRMLGDFNVDILSLSETIILDQSLTAQLLKLCNSAHYGFSKKIISVNDAIAKLGLNTVKSLVFVAVSKGILDKEAKGYALLKGDLWRNSVACAYYSKFLAEVFAYKNQDLAFTTGLLRDIGKLVLTEYVGINYKKIITLVETGEISFTRAEEMCLGYNHAQVGAQILKQWNLPDVIVQCVQYHHDFFNVYNTMKNDVIDLELLAILHLADAFTIMLGNSIGSDGLMYPIDDVALQILNKNNLEISVEELIDQLVDLNNEINLVVKVLK